jgi:hypothetical protein
MVFQVQAFVCRVGCNPFPISQFDFKPSSIEIGDHELHAAMGGEVSGPGGYLLVHIEVFQVLSIFGRNIVPLFEAVHFEGTLQRHEGFAHWDFFQVLCPPVGEGGLSLGTDFCHGSWFVSIQGSRADKLVLMSPSGHGVEFTFEDQDLD